MTSRLVYSSESGRVASERERRERKERSPAGAAPVPAAPNDGVVRVWRVKGGRGGKTATVVTGVPAADVERLAVELRRFIGAGGSVRQGAVEVQGDHRARLLEKLTDMGFRVKLAGG